MFDPAVAAVEGALAAGAEYADARVVVSRRQHLESLNETIESLEQSESADVPVREDSYETPHDEDPFAVSLAEKADLLVGVTKTMRAVDGVALAKAFLT